MIYPYGIGGELPSNIGIINDLTTGGADKALSAEMGKYLQGEVENLQANIGELSEITNITSLFDNSTWTQQKFIVGKATSSQALGDMESSSSQNSFASGYVDISDFDKITITLPQLNLQGVIAGACFYDENYTPLLGMAKGEMAPAGMFEYTFDVPEDAVYIRATKRTDTGFASFSCHGIAGKRVIDIIDELDSYVNPSKNIPFNKESGAINVNGVYEANADISVTDSIDISDIEYIYYSRMKNSSASSIYTASFFDDNNEFICGETPLSGSGEYAPSVVAKPDNAKYLRLCFFNSDAYGRRMVLNVTDAYIKNSTVWNTINNLIFTDSKLISSQNGLVYDSTSHKCTEDFIDIHEFRGGKMFYPRVYFNSSTQIYAGMAFYDKYNNYISGIPAKIGTFDANHHVKTTVDIPSNAYFVRLSVLLNSEGPFEITLCSFSSVYDNVRFYDTNIDTYDYSYGESESRFRFYKAMEEKLDNYGITDYIIESPGGYGRSDNANEIPNPVLGHGLCQLPVYGLAKIVSMAINYPALADIWAATNHIIRTKGVEGEVVVTKTIDGTYGHFLTDYYTILSWKTGTDEVNPVRNIYCTATNDALKGQILSGVVSFHRNSENDTYNRYKAMKILLDIGTARYLDREADTSALESAFLEQDISHAQVIVTPTYTRFMKGWDLNTSSYYRLYDYHGGAETMNTMSTVKLLTALVVLDYIEDLDTYVEVSENDLYWGQYPINTVTFSAGAKVTYRDLLYGLLFPSWNQAAYCLARNVGNYLLRTYRGDHFLDNSTPTAQ